MGPAPLQFEDFETARAFEILRRQRSKLLCFNDDMWVQGGSGSVLMHQRWRRHLLQRAACAVTSLLKCPRVLASSLPFACSQGTGAVVTSGFINGMK